MRLIIPEQSRKNMTAYKISFTPKKLNKKFLIKTLLTIKYTSVNFIPRKNFILPRLKACQCDLFHRETV